jgi:CHAD domain-containing protein
MLPDYVKLKDIKPALSGYIREANSMLPTDAIPDEKVVHDIRVLMKKSRAVMKLIKGQIDEPAFNREYNTFRETGRKMQEWRETSVHRKILKDLRKKHPDIFTGLRDHEKINFLLRKPEATEPSPEARENLGNIAGLLNKSGYRLRFQPMNNLDPHLLLKQLEMTYIDVSDNYLTARNTLKSPDLHEFRKKTKDFLYQLYFFRSLKPKVVRDLENRLDTLAQNLGRYNDLAVLLETLDYRHSRQKQSSA